MKVEGLLKCRCGVEMVVYYDNDGVVQIMEVVKDENGEYQPVEGD